MEKEPRIRKFKKKLKARNAFDILPSLEEKYRDENGKIKKLKVYRFYFDRHIDIVLFWAFVFLSGMTFVIGTALSPLDWWVKLIIMSNTIMIGCEMVLLNHEQLILMQRINEVLERINSKDKK